MATTNFQIYNAIATAHQHSYDAAMCSATAYIDAAIRQGKEYSLTEKQKKECIENDEYIAYATTEIRHRGLVELGILSVTKDSNGSVMFTGHDYYTGETYENVYPLHNIDSLNGIVYFVDDWYQKKQFKD